MRFLRFSRLMMLLALLVCLRPASSKAAVFVSVGIAPPALPVYVQPPCPEPGWMWTPGYWAYGADGYYWVPGTWVPSPYVGALWTPGYWGWGGGLYAWHPGYWGPHIGYYGGVNYGFGFFGVGFVGGAWHGGVFAYNTAVMRVGVGPGWGGNRVYVDRTVIVHNTIVNNHVAYSGGPGGINHPPTAEEDRYSHEQHMAASSFQEQHRAAAMNDHANYFNNNHGHPTNAAMARPMSASHGNFNNNAAQHGNFNNNAGRPNNGFTPHQNGGGNFTPQANRNEGHPQPQSQPAPQHEQPHGQPHGGRDNDHGR
jgi:hypothetical protein